ncbi:hypothetical protein [Thomasclavelia sp.]|uniref:hypothetical protein n=1 Tax=Thomasclavelia sp. TaxID=3025757 RepID=UPI002600F8B0|nr:hypothetical protein [Thomasclavelia sp.]
MVYVQREKINDIIGYLELLKEDAVNEDMMHSITQIQNDLLENTVKNKRNVLDEINRLINLTASLKEHVFILEDKNACENINIQDYSMLISESLIYIEILLREFYIAINNLEIKKAGINPTG